MGKTRDKSSAKKKNVNVEIEKQVCVSSASTDDTNFDNLNYKAAIVAKGKKMTDFKVDAIDFLGVTEASLCNGDTVIKLEFRQDEYQGEVTGAQVKTPTSVTITLHHVYLDLDTDSPLKYLGNEIFDAIIARLIQDRTYVHQAVIQALDDRSLMERQAEQLSCC